MSGYINIDTEDAYRRQRQERDELDEKSRQEEANMEETLEAQRLQWEEMDRLKEELQKSK